ncbi:hypothetical protein BD414DRAFT_485450 [Trametes punicea]|nr:hypothetical protein BD414DRAFT_485450 [Trametes punicea]
MHPGANPVIPPPTMTGAVPTVGNPFPAPPLNMTMNMGPPDLYGPMGLADPVIPGQGQSPEAPVVPPVPPSFRGRAGTPYHRASSPWTSSDSDDDDDITSERRERMQPPLAPGQYGPYDRISDRRGHPPPALRRSHHRRAESSPAFRRDRSPSFAQDREPPVIPQGGDGMYGHPPFPQPQVPPTFAQADFPRREPSPTFRPRPFSPIQIRHNPLPPPPKDLFQQSPYARVLRELRKPIDDEEIKAKLASQAAIHTVGAIPVPLAQPGHHQHGTRSSKEKKRKGLFRSLSSRLHPHRTDDGYDDVSPPGGVPQAFVGGQSAAVYPVMQTMPDGSIALIYNPPGPQMAQVPSGNPVPNGQAAPVIPPVPPVMPGYVPGAAPAVSPGVIPATPQQYPPGVAPSASQPYPPPGARAPSPARMRMPTPQPAPPPAPPRPIRIDRTNEYAGLLHTSLHKVHYDHKSYPTALHLLEALRFLPAHPDYAEQVRRCGTPEEATAIASNCRHLWRPDWEAVFENLVSLRRRRRARASVLLSARSAL